MERSLLWKVLQVPCWIGTKLLFDLKVYGIENVPKTGGALLVANHQSFIDPIAIAVRLRRPVSYLARSDLFENPFVGWLISSLHAFPVRRGQGDLGAIRETIHRLEEGHILNIYPEGTRTEDGEIAPFQKGIALILRKADVPVVPVAIDGSFQAWPHNRTLFQPHPVRVIYGKPLYFKGMKADQTLQVLHEKLCALLIQLRSKNRA